MLAADEEPRWSLAYRKASGEIWAGKVPHKYARLVPHVGGARILEIGAAEGVLALTLAQQANVTRVTALELRAERHREAQALQRHWAEAGRDVSRCLMLAGDIRERLYLLDEADTLVAVRTVYYLRDDALSVMQSARLRGVTRVVLCGNRNRQAQHRALPKSELGRFNRLASTEGMLALLRDAGFNAYVADERDDPVVIGHG